MPTPQQAAQRAHHGRHQRVVSTPNSYYSGGGFRPSGAPTKAGAAYTASINSGRKSKLFSYAEGAPMDPAFSGVNGRIATTADTNLVGAGGQPIGGDELEIFGISLQILPECRSPALAAKLWSNCSLAIYYNGRDIGFLVGPPFFVPGQSSLYGLAEDAAAPTPLAGGGTGVTGAYGFWSNGVPGIDNFFHIPEGLLWTSAGRVDSNFTIDIVLQRDIELAVAASRAADDGIAAWDQPVASEGDLDVSFMCKLHARVTSDRSHNR